MPQNGRWCQALHKPMARPGSCMRLLDDALRRARLADVRAIQDMVARPAEGRVGTDFLRAPVID
jgi:hypothetical protein